MVLANAALLRFYLARRDPGWLDGGEFERMRWPLRARRGLRARGPRCRRRPAPAAYNVLLVLGVLLRAPGAGRGRFLRAPPGRAALAARGGGLLVLVNPWAPQILALLGLFDIWIDFRKWAEPPGSEEG